MNRVKSWTDIIRVGDAVIGTMFLALSGCGKGEPQMPPVLVCPPDTVQEDDVCVRTEYRDREVERVVVKEMEVIKNIPTKPQLAVTFHPIEHIPIAGSRDIQLGWIRISPSAAADIWLQQIHLNYSATDSAIRNLRLYEDDAPVSSILSEPQGSATLQLDGAVRFQDGKGRKFAIVADLADSGEVYLEGFLESLVEAADAEGNPVPTVTTGNFKVSLGPVYQSFLIIEAASDAPQGTAAPTPNQTVGKWLIHNAGPEQAIVSALFLQVYGSVACVRPCAMSLHPDSPNSTALWRLEHSVGELQGYVNWLALEQNIAIAPYSTKVIFLVADTDDATSGHSLLVNLRDAFWADREIHDSLPHPREDWRTLTY